MRQMHHTRRTFGILGILGAAALALAGCGGDKKTSTGPAAAFDGTGVYELVSYDGHTVPYIFPDSVAADQRVVSGSLTFQSTSGTSGTVAICERRNAVSNPSAITDACATYNWTLSGQTLSLDFQGIATLDGSVSGAFVDLGFLSPDLSRTMIMHYRKR